MGKIRVKTIGDEAAETEAKQKADQKREQKKAREKTHLPGMEGGQRVAVVGPTEEELEKISVQTETTGQEGQKQETKKKKAKFAKKSRGRSANYTAKVMEVDKNKVYSLSEALEILKKIGQGKFDETVELHINTTQSGINGQVKLPHGTGKETRVVVANDELLAEVEKGKIDFDILIAAPSMMPKLARVAKVLGPKGLMPNPKNGTISENPEEAMKKFQGGQVSFKTESKNPIMHLTVGKMSFGNDKLSENIVAMLGAVKKDRILKITLKSTMSPGIKIQA